MYYLRINRQISVKMKHLTEEQRYEIYGYLRAGFKKSKIAEMLGVHKSTITRELQRNGYGNSRQYIPGEAQKKAERRWRHRKLLRKHDKSMKTRVEYYLRKLQLSPEQIVGYCRRKGISIVSHETIYQWIWRDKKYGGDLYKHLRHKGRKYRRRGLQNNSRRHIPNAVDISERPAIVDERTRFGDFEVDTIVGNSQSQHILTITERSTGLLIMRKLNRPTAKETEDKMIEALSFLAQREHVKTITADNGIQFANHQAISKELRADFYFARPYHSWERATNENTNGLIRQYIPKSSDFNLLSEDDIRQIEDKLNKRPRKRLKFASPYEAAKNKIKIDLKVAFRT